MPELLPRKIVAVEPGGAKADDDALAVGNGGGGAEGILALSGLAGGILHARLPEDLAVGTIEADERTAMRRSDGLGDEDSICPKRWG